MVDFCGAQAASSSSAVSAPQAHRATIMTSASISAKVFLIVVFSFIFLVFHQDGQAVLDDPLLFHRRYGDPRFLRMVIRLHPGKARRLHRTGDLLRRIGLHPVDDLLKLLCGGIRSVGLVHYEEGLAGFQHPAHFPEAVLQSRPEIDGLKGRGCGSAGICRRPMSWAGPCDETGNSKNKGL